MEPGGLKVVLQDVRGEGFIHAVFLNQGYQQGSGNRHHLGGGTEILDCISVGVARDGGPGGDDPDGGGATEFQRGLGTGYDHPGDRQGSPGRHCLEGDCRSCVAGDENLLHAEVFKVSRDLGCVVDDRAGAPGPVGDAGGVSDVDDILVGEVLLDGIDHREPSDAGVEYADGKGIHGRKGGGYLATLIRALRIRTGDPPRLRFWNPIRPLRGRSRRAGASLPLCLLITVSSLERS